MGIEYWNCRCPAKFRAGDCSIKIWNLIIPFNPYLLPLGHVLYIALPCSCSNYCLKVISMESSFQGWGASSSAFGRCRMLFVIQSGSSLWIGSAACACHSESRAQCIVPAYAHTQFTEDLSVHQCPPSPLSSFHLTLLLPWEPKNIIHTVYIHTHTYIYIHILQGFLVSEDGEGENCVKQKCPKINLLRPTRTWLCIFRGSFVSVPESFLDPVVPTLPLSVFPRFCIF